MHGLTFRKQRRLPADRGFVLLECLIAILVFSFGVLSIMSLQANSIAVVRDSKFRSDAGLLANQIIGRMWSDRANLASYQLNGTSADCATGSNSSSNAKVTAWLADMQSVLPQTVGVRQKIAVTSDAMVTVTICWAGPQDASGSFRRHTVTAHIRG